MLPEKSGDGGMDPCMRSRITRWIPHPSLPFAGPDEEGPDSPELEEEWLDIVGCYAGIPGFRDIEDSSRRKDLSCPEGIRNGGSFRAEMGGRIDVGP